MTAFNVGGRTAQTANPRRAQRHVGKRSPPHLVASVPIPRRFKPGEFAAEEERKFQYRRDHEERMYYAERCSKGDQFRTPGGTLGIPGYPETMSRWAIRKQET